MAQNDKPQKHYGEYAQTKNKDGKEEQAKFDATNEVAVRTVKARKTLILTTGAVYCTPNGQRVYAPAGADITDMSKQDFDHFKKVGVIAEKMVEISE